jgi:RNA recognition motif-containing protein
MDVFVGNLPETISVSELERLLFPFDRQVQIKLQHQQYREGQAVCYGVCTFSSERLAHKAIKKLDGYHLFGRALAVREYLYRSYSNERRALGWRERAWDGAERRDGERRHGTVRAAPVDIFAEEELEEAVDEEHILIEGYRDLATKQT